MKHISQSEWINIPRPNREAKFRLMCIPYAGGSAGVFLRWPTQMDAQVEVCALEVPGKGLRLREAPITVMSRLIEELAGGIGPLLDKPFAIFGHGSGALIGFELTRHLRNNSGPQPKHLFVGGSRPPQMAPSNSLPRYDLPEPEFLDALRQMNGIPSEVSKHPELMQLMLPVFRADAELAQTYIYRSEPPLDVPISAYGGLEDPDCTRKELEGWRDQTSAPFKLQIFPGDYFFLHSAKPLLLRAISQELAAI
jgi:medium-chain acyl-[acyl-carrier-protein] hydrolase